ncbi:MAG: thiamine phosphate synthase [Candidatus Brocadiaceae bacterium]|nr:thiamine phosphate synthase [Candidatus Brocadiaceae bacterium]
MVNSISGLDLVLITDRKMCKAKLTDVIMQAVEGGVDTVQLREKDLNTRDLYDLAKEAREITKKKDVKLIINDRVDVAIAVEADGVHLGWQSIGIEIARMVIGHDMMIGFSAHSIKDAESAEKSGADYVSISPIFKTTPKDFFIKPFGVDEIGKIKELVNIPVVALGGINENNIEEVLKNGADGIAVISAIFHSDNPEQSATNLCRKIKHYKS